MMLAGSITPEWTAPDGVRSTCTSRQGGVSAGPYASLNLGDHVGDEAGCVAANRRRLHETLRARPVFLRQVHGKGVVELDSRTPDGVEADACFTQERGVACTIMVADCMPVLFASDAGTVVGAAHAGWRGLAGNAGVGVLESLVSQLEGAAGVRAEALVAWLGPCIGPKAFEVGGEVREAFLATDSAAALAFRPVAGDKFLADLPALARRRLSALGVARVFGNDGTLPWCTFANPSIFFSHRRDRVSGRFAASVWLR